MNAPTEFAELLIPIARIERSPTNPRETFDDEKLASLTESIKRHGVLQPILLRPWPATYPHAKPLPDYELVAGERRWRGAAAAGLDAIPAKVRNLTDNEVLEIQIIENLQREDLHPIEEANGYERMMADYGYTAESLAEKIGKSKAYIYARVKLTALCHEARKAFREGKLNPSTALLIARIPTNALQIRATQEITDPNWRHEVMSVRAAQEHIHSNYMLRLVEAPFSRKDPDLVKKAGSCDACPKRTGNQPTDLFEDVKSADVCTDPECHQEKRQAQVKKLAEEATSKGKTVVIGKAAEKMMPHGSIVGHTKLDDICYDAQPNSKHQHPTYRALLKQAEVETVLVEDVRKKVLVEYVPNKQLAIALKAAGLKSRGDDQRDESKKARDKLELARAYREALYSQTIAAIRADYARGNVDGRDDDLRLVAEAMYRSLGFDTQQAFVKTKVEGKVNNDVVAAYKDQIRLLAGIDLQMELIEMALCGALVVSQWSMEREPEQLVDVAKDLGIDPAQVRKSVADARREQAKAKKSAGSAQKAPKTPKKPAPIVVADPIPPTKAARAAELDAAGKTKAAQATTTPTGTWAWPFPTNQIKSDDSGQASLAERKPVKPVIEKNEAAPAGPQKQKATAVPTSTEDDKLKIGDRVRIKQGVRGPNRHFQKVCGREGVIEIEADGIYSVRLGAGRNGLANDLRAEDLELLDDAS